MKTRHIICTALFGAVVAGVITTLVINRASQESPSKPTRPNILIIISDDYGYADAGFQGSKDILTPHLDRLAKEGIRFTDGYSSHPYCSPTRAGILTGRSAQRFGMELNPAYNPADQTEGLPLSETLLPEYLTAAGYVTGWVGKWHLGAAPHFAPERRGFQETFGALGGSHFYHSWTPDAAVQLKEPILRNGIAVDPPKHMTVAQGREAAAFVRRHRNEPWFLYLAFNAPHSPNQPTQERYKRFAHINDEARRLYAAQVSLMDDAIGETLGALRDSKQSERTLVFFLSDNGGPVGFNGSDNTPLNEGKGSLKEGGVRVPFLVSWPTHLAAGKTEARMVSSMDIFATTLAVAGIQMPTDKKYDSVNILPYLTGEKNDAPHDALYWRSGEMRAMREGNWKLLRYKNHPWLFDLSTDISESNDLASKHPEVVARMVPKLKAWNKELLPQAFTGTSTRYLVKEHQNKIHQD